MREINENELKQIDGGFSISAAIGIGIGVVFLIGLIDGYVRPLSCNE